jgi:hypothetical protein
MATTVVFKNDSDGYQHQTCAQSALDSCGPASMFMTACIKKQMSMAGGEDKIMELSCAFPGHMNFQNAGTITDNIVQTMGTLGVGAASIESNFSSPGSTIIKPGKCYSDHPALILVGWYQSGKRNGGHYVVAPYFKDDGSAVVILDPWKGQLVELVNDGKFSSATGSGLIEWVFYT